MPRINPTFAPRTAIAVGALAVATSSVFIDLSGTSPGTSTFYRCLLAMPLVAVPAIRERRSRGSLPGRGIGVALVAGAFFAGDALLWTAAIYELGAGLATVVVNAQVLILPLLARILDRERIGRRYLVALAPMIIGIALTAGLISQGRTGTDPLLGTLHGIAAALCYSGFLYLLRRGGMGGLVIQPYLWVICSAALVGLVIGLLWHGMDLTPGWQAFGWLILTALVGQSIGWLLVAIVSPHLRSTVSAALLLFTPVGALLLSAVATGERPSPTQLAGAVLVLAGAYLASTGSPGAEPERPHQTGNRRDRIDR